MEEPGAGLLTATFFVQLEDRAPIAIGQPRFDRWLLRADGMWDHDKGMQACAAALGTLLPLWLCRQGDEKVIEAESRFAHRRHQAESHWHPSDEQLALLAAALERAGITPGVARRIRKPG